MPISNPRIIVVRAGGEYAEALECSTMQEARAAADRLAAQSEAEVYILVPKVKAVPEMSVKFVSVSEG